MLGLPGAERADALAIEILSVSQTVDADAFARTGMEFDSQARGDGREPTDPPQLSLEVEANAGTTQSVVQGAAAHSALLSPQELSGQAEVFSRVTFLPNASDTEGSGSGSALFQACFQVDETFSWILSGSLDSLAAFGSEGFARVQLVETESGQVLFEAESLPMDTTPFQTEVLLAQGDEYELLLIAEALSDMPPTTSTGGSAGFDFSLVPVPEPGTAAGVLLGLALLAARRRGHS